MRKLFLSLFLLVTTALSFADKSWYFDQKGTGIGNCGPASVAMLITYTEHIRIPVQAIREEIGYTRDDGSTDLDELSGALDHHRVRYSKLTMKTKTDLDELLKTRHIVLVDVDMSYIPNKSNYDKGHYLVLSSRSGDTYEVQDPLNGSDLHYNADLVWSAMKTREVLVAGGSSPMLTFGFIAKILFDIDVAAIVIPKKIFLPC